MTPRPRAPAPKEQAKSPVIEKRWYEAGVQQIPTVVSALGGDGPGFAFPEQEAAGIDAAGKEFSCTVAARHGRRTSARLLGGLVDFAARPCSSPGQGPDEEEHGGCDGKDEEFHGEAEAPVVAEVGATGAEPHAAAQDQGINLIVVKIEEAKHGFVLLPKRWVVERSFAWASRFRRLARDYEHLPTTLSGLRWVDFLVLGLGNLFSISAWHALWIVRLQHIRKFCPTAHVDHKVWSWNWSWWRTSERKPAGRWPAMRSSISRQIARHEGSCTRLTVSRGSPSRS